jgi:hypothetical protein
MMITRVPEILISYNLLQQMRQNKDACGILVGNPEGNRPKQGRMDNIKIDLRETAWGGMDWIHLAWDKDQ